MLRVFLIGLAGLVGTLCRYWLSGVLARRYGETFPAGTLVVNVLGCLLIGFLGGFTTFSSYGLQTFTLLRDGEFAYAAVNVVASNVIGILMVWVGYMLARVMGGL